MDRKKQIQLSIAVGILFLLVITAAWLVNEMLRSHPAPRPNPRKAPMRITRKVPKPPAPAPQAVPDPAGQVVETAPADSTAPETPAFDPGSTDVPPVDIPAADTDSPTAQPSPGTAGQDLEPVGPLPPTPEKQPLEPLDEPADLYTVQVGAFLREANALRFEQQLKKSGYSVYIQPHKTAKGRQWYLVRIGDYNSLSDATTARRAFRRKEALPAIITLIDSITPVGTKR